MIWVLVVIVKAASGASQGMVVHEYQTKEACMKVYREYKKEDHVECIETQRNGPKHKALLKNAADLADKEAGFSL